MPHLELNLRAANQARDQPLMQHWRRVRERHHDQTRTAHRNADALIAFSKRFPSAMVAVTTDYTNSMQLPHFTDRRPNAFARLTFHNTPESFIFHFISRAPYAPHISALD